MSFVLYCFCATYFSISCAAGDGFLILGCLYLQIGWWPFVCRWPNLRWHLILGQKKWVAMLYGTASKPEQITNTANLTRSHSWPIAKASRPTKRQRERKKIQPAVYISPTLYLTPLWWLTERLSKTEKKETSLQPHTTTQAQLRKQTRALLQNLLKSLLLISSIVLCKSRAARTKMCNLSCCDISDAGRGGSAETNVFCFPFSFLFFLHHFHTEQKQAMLHSPLSLSF